MDDQIGKVQTVALALGFEEKMASSIAAMEARCLDHLESGGASGRKAAAKLLTRTWPAEYSGSMPG